jgi:hypothetical protein
MIKKAYYSYWSGGYQSQPSQLILDLNKISLYLARKTFDEIHLITDSASKDSFKKLKFDSVTTELDCVDTSYGDIWSLGKVYAYKIAAEKGDPFLHIDYDVFFWEKIASEFLSKQILCQWEEKNSYYSYDIPKLLKTCPNLHLINNIQPKNAWNVGIFGGSDLDFIKKYAERSIEFTMDPENEVFWKRKDIFSTMWQKPVITEQYYLEVCRIYYKKHIDTLLVKEWFNKDACDKNFTHIMAGKIHKDIKEKIHKLALKIEEKEKNKNIIKVFGLPKSGTNLIQLLLSLNLKNYVCQFADHPNMHYLGWKHGHPQDISTYDILEKHLNQKCYFVFMIRDFESWKESIINRHSNSHEFPWKFSNLKKGIIYNTPIGPEYYNSLKELYDCYTNKYYEFAKKYNERCIVVDFKELQNSQTNVVFSIKEKFEMDLINKTVFEIKKQLDSAGNINYFRYNE